MFILAVQAHAYFALGDGRAGVRLTSSYILKSLSLSVRDIMVSVRLLAPQVSLFCSIYVYIYTTKGAISSCTVCFNFIQTTKTSRGLVYRDCAWNLQ